MPGQKVPLQEMTLQRTDPKNPDFIRLVQELDVYLTEKDGEEHGFYDHYNKLDSIKHVLIVYENERAVSCGGFKEYSPGVVEIKRMYTVPGARGKGYASLVLEGLEKWAAELGYSKAILETGKRQEEAVQFYPKNGYRLIPNYGQYEGVENSLCFEKDID